MVHINEGAGEIGVKIVYCSVFPRGGQWSLHALKEVLPEESTGNIISIATESGNTLFFDFLAVSLGKAGNFRINLKLYAAPEASYYEASRKLVVDGADGIVFIADPSREKQEHNREMLQRITGHIHRNPVPVVFQYMYTAQEEAGSLLNTHELDTSLETEPSFSINSSGDILLPLKELVKQVFDKDRIRSE